MWDSLSENQQSVLATLCAQKDRHARFREENPSPYLPISVFYKGQRKWRGKTKNASSHYVKILRALVDKKLVSKHPKKMGLYQILAKGTRIVPADFRNY